MICLNEATIQYTEEYGTYPIVGAMDIAIAEGEARRDITIEEEAYVRIWGRVMRKNGEPCYHALVTLLAPVYVRGEATYSAVASIFTDEQGYFQFHMKKNECNLPYKLIADQEINFVKE